MTPLPLLKIIRVLANFISFLNVSLFQHFRLHCSSQAKKMMKFGFCLQLIINKCYAKSTSNRLSSPYYIEIDQYFIRCNFGRCVMICFKLWRVASHVSLSLEARKGKNNHGHDDKFCRVLSNFCHLKATIFLLLIYIQISFNDHEMQLCFMPLKNCLKKNSSRV